MISVSSYASLEALPRGLGCEVSSIMLREENGCWELDTDEIKKSIKKNTKMIVINFPHNPTGKKKKKKKL